jgi:hypothetical protein
MAQVVSRQPLIAEFQVRARANPCIICGGQRHRNMFFSEFLVFPCQYLSTVAPHSYPYITWGMNNRPLRSRISEQSHPVDTNSNTLYYNHLYLFWGGGGYCCHSLCLGILVVFFPSCDHCFNGRK